MNKSIPFYTSTLKYSVYTAQTPLKVKKGQSETTQNLCYSWSHAENKVHGQVLPCTTWEPHFLLDRDTRVHCSTVKLLPETVVRYPHGLLTSCFLKVISTYISTIDSARRSWIESDPWWPHWKEMKCSDFGHHSHLGVFLTLWHLPSWSTDKYTNANTLIKQ